MKRDRIQFAAMTLAAAVFFGGVSPEAATAESEAAASPGAEATADTRTLMREMFGAFARLVHHTGDPEAFASRAAREEIVRSLQLLQRNAGRLEGHVGHGSLTSAHEAVGRSFTRNVATALDRYIVGQYESARFLTDQLVENCFACHTKLPASHRFEFGAQLLAEEPIASLPPDRKARLAVAARQFDTALELLEAYLADPQNSAVDVALSGAFESYLKIDLRVRGDRSRAIRTFEAFRTRTDLPFYLRGEIDAWLEALRTLDPAAPPGNRLSSARKLVETARAVTAYPGDRRGLVHFVVASRWLYEHASGAELSREERAETLLWLGLCEVHVASSLWVSEAEGFLESAIHTAPESGFAREAYGVLEAVYVEGYTGSAGTHLPPEVERRLASLRERVGLEAATEEITEP